MGQQYLDSLFQKDLSHGTTNGLDGYHKQDFNVMSESVLREYTHGISNRLDNSTVGATNITCKFAI